MSESRAGLTDKQYKILTVICHGNKELDGTWSPVDMDELLERVAYETTKQSMQFSIRALISRKLIEKGTEKRRGASRVTYIPTRTAKLMMGYHDPHFVEDRDLSHLDI